MSSRTNEWATPKDFYKALDAEFHFTLDPCSTDENAKCEHHYTIEDDGLTQDWGGRLFSAILHTDGQSPPGCASATRKAASRTPAW